MCGINANEVKSVVVNLRNKERNIQFWKAISQWFRKICNVRKSYEYVCIYYYINEPYHLVFQFIFEKNVHIIGNNLMQELVKGLLGYWNLF